MQRHLIYIHGFLSSPQSLKAQQVKIWCENARQPIQFHCPALSAYPNEVVSQLEALITHCKLDGGEQIAFIGSSLGGYYATFFAEKYHCQTLLINPAVKPYELITTYLNQPLKNYHHNEHYTLTTAHMELLKQLEVAQLNSHNRIWLLAQMGDETLDYRQAQTRYQGCKQTIEPGGDHSFQGFERYRDDILNFLFPDL